ncbi:E3 ubiquitin-protein ligase listerin [Lingula anatina]|uniref:E3 ubiquitin-protein ligase listerin n=1 Tax=Lingula anatina TaxID=7574 RepID=A0A1S3HLE6_LINAN|nr:E3 ubiquitin-protein ligase listerin [Lingula anatina]|eukprot:XP_013385834.1 E3 ubiquitin-protein ligase listerin [Lingula anatina]
MPGGKKQHAQRTKGNVRPSSSGRAAELLAASSGGNVHGFVGFQTLSGDLGYVPAAGATDEADSSVDPDFRMVLRKLSKRDTTTKLKALQEFSVLCKEKDTEVVKSVLPYWPRLYNKIALDNDRRVREAAQHAFEQLLLKVKKSIAPHLKPLMGVWLISQCDAYAPAASAAKAAFLAAFPVSKQSDAVAFCKEEVMNYLIDNLIDQTAKTLSDPKTTPEEEMEQKYQRMLMSSLHAWKMLINVVSAEEQESLLDKYKKILKENKFWKNLGKHQNGMIRGAFYSVLSTLCQVHPAVASEFSEKISQSVLYNLDDMDPVVCAHLWETALVILSSLEDCWSNVNPRKGVLPKLWKVMKLGGSGSAGVICPNWLPLLSKIPEEIIGEGTGFYQEFFGNIKIGLCEGRVQQSPSEMAAIIKAMIECLRYCLVQKLGDSSELQKHIILDQLIPLLEASFYEAKSPLSSSPLYSLVVDLTQYIHKQSHCAEDEEKRALWAQTSNLFWDNFKSQCRSWFVRSHDCKTLGFILDRFGTFLESFKKSQPGRMQKKKTGKIHFSDTNEKDFDIELPYVSAEEKHLVPEKEGIVQPDSLLNIESPLMQIVYELSCTSAKTFSGVYLTFLSRMCITYGGKTLFMHLCSDSITRQPETSEVELVFFKERLLSKLKHLEGDSDKFGHDLSKLVDILLSVYRSADVDTRKNILLTLCEEIDHPAVFQMLVERLRGFKDTIFKQWMKSKVFGEKMVLFAEELCQECLGNGGDERSQRDVDASWSLLTLALTTDDAHETLIAAEYIDKMLMKIRAALPSPNHKWQSSPEELNRCVAFVCDVALNFFTNIQDCLMISSTEELLLSLFQLGVQWNLNLAAHLHEKIKKTWKQGVKALVLQQGGLLKEEGFFCKAAEFMKSYVRKECYSVERLNSVCTLAVELVNTIFESIQDEVEDEGLVAVPLQTPLIQAYVEMLVTDEELHVKDGWKTWPLVSGQLLFSSFPTDTPVNEETVPPCLPSVYFTSKLLTDAGALDAHADSAVTARLSAVTEKLAYCVAYCEACLGCHREALFHSELNKSLIIADENFSCIYKSLSQLTKTTIIRASLERSLNSGGMSALALDVLLRNEELADIEVMSLLGGIDRFADLNEITVQTLLVLLPYLKSTDRLSLIEIMAARIISCEAEEIMNIDGCLGPLAIASKAFNLAFNGTEDRLELTELAIGIVNSVLEMREKHDDLFAFSNIKTLSWNTVNFNVWMIRFLEVLVNHIPTKLEDGHWDFVQCSLAAWIQSCQECGLALHTHAPVLVLFADACNLLAAVATCMKNVVPQQKDSFPDGLLTEWTEFFSQGNYTTLLPIFVKYSDNLNVLKQPLALDYQLRCLGAAMALCPVEHLKSHQLPAKLKADDNSNLPDEIQTLLNHLCPHLLSHHRAVLLTVYKLLFSTMPELTLFNEGKSTDDSNEENSRAPPEPLLSILNTTTNVIDHILGDLKVGERMLIEPHIEEFTVAMGYLLSWKLILEFFKGATSELRAEYATYLKQTNAVHNLMVNLFRLMPENPTVQSTDLQLAQSPANKLSGSMNLFAEEPDLNIKGDFSTVELQHLACSVYYAALQDIPALIRQWWTDQDKRITMEVEKFTSKYVSPLLCAQEIKDVQERRVEFDNMVVKARSTTREVIATYTVEDFSMELIIQLPANHPLGQISVEWGKRIGVANLQWRNWILQMTTFLSYQNGSIIDGLSLWKRNVDKRFEGVEECMICFSVIHGSNCQLPKLQCKTCKKKFHNACLYKWFSTSNNSTCPLCRNLF